MPKTQGFKIISLLLKVIVAAFLFTPVGAVDNFKDVELTRFTSRISEYSMPNLYQETLKYLNGQGESGPKDKTLRLNKATTNFLVLARQNYLPAIYQYATLCYQQKRFLSALIWFNKAYNQGEDRAEKRLIQIKTEIKKSGLRLNPAEGKQIKLFLTGRYFQMIEELPHELIQSVLSYLPLKDLGKSQQVCAFFYDVGDKIFEEWGQKTVSSLDLSYYTALLKDAQSLDWKRMAICQALVDQGSVLLKHPEYLYRSKGIIFLKKAATLGSFKAYKKIVKNNFYTYERKYLTSLIIRLSSLPFSGDEKTYRQIKYTQAYEKKTDHQQFKELARQGHPKACYQMYLHTKLKTYLLPAVDAGYAKAQYQLALLKLTEDKVEVEEVIQLLSLAANQDYIEAQYELAYLMKQQGDELETKRWLSLAASQGHPYAQNNLAIIIYSEGKKIRAKKLFALAAAQGQLDAYYNLGLIAKVENNLKEAKRLFKTAARQLHIEALYELGMLSKKKGRITKAKIYLTQAADNNHPCAQFELGAVFEAEDNLIKAQRLFICSAEQGFDGAKEALERLKNRILMHPGPGK